MAKAHAVKPVSVFLTALSLSACSNQMMYSDIITPPKQAIALISFQGVQKNAWKMDALKRAWTGSHQVTFNGTCTRGIYFIAVMQAGTQLGENAYCAEDQSFHWTHSSLVDGEYPLVFQGMSRSQQATGNIIAQTIQVDSSVPLSPVLTTNNGAGFTSPTQVVTLQGTVTPDVHVLQVSTTLGTLSFVPGSGVFSYSYSLSAGQTQILTFTASNFMGIASSPTSISVAYAPNLILAAHAFSGAHSSGIARVSDQGSLKLRNLNLSAFPSRATRTLAQSGQFRISTGINQVNGNR